MLKEFGLWVAKHGGYAEGAICHDCHEVQQMKADWTEAEQRYQELIRILQSRLNAK